MPLYHSPRPAPAFRDFAEAAGFHLAGEGCLYWRYRYSPTSGGWLGARPDGTWELADSLMEVVATASPILREDLAWPLPPLAFRNVLPPAREPTRPEHRAKNLEPLTAWPVVPFDADAFARWQRDEDARSAVRMESYSKGRPYDPALWRSVFASQPMPPIEPVIATEHRERLLRAVNLRNVRAALEWASAYPSMALDPDDAPLSDYAPETFIATALVRDRSARVRTPDVYRTYRESVPDGRRPVSSRAFRALVRSMLAPAEVKSSGYEFYVGLRLRTVQDDAPAPATDSRPALYAVG